MKSFLLSAASVTLAAFAIIIFWYRQKPSPGDSNKKIITTAVQSEEWQKAAEFEFKKTYDGSLGYIPAGRLIRAVDDLKRGRFTRSGTAARTGAGLVWMERGPLFDLQGRYGNPRPPGVSCAGRIDALCVDKADPTGHKVWAGSHGGGIWKTNDISAETPQWKLADDFMGSLSIGSICQDPSNTDIMYVGTGDKTSPWNIKGGGIWKSIDHGNFWNLLPSTTSFQSISKVECDKAGNVYAAGTGNNTGVRRSKDGGATWVNITPNGLSGNIADMDLDSDGSLHIYCGFLESGVTNCGYRYTASPATVTSFSGWSAPTTPFPFSKVTVQITARGKTILAMPSNSDYVVNQFYKSTDGGANWAPTGSTPYAPYWSCLDAAINPANPDQIIFGSFDAYKTSDGGKTWIQSENGSSSISGKYIHHDYHVFLWQGNEVLAGTDGGIYFSPDNGANFYSKSAGIRSFEFYSCALHPSLPNYIMGGTQDNGIEQLTNTGLDRAVHVIGGDGGYVHIDQDEPQYQFCSTTNNNYRKSTDGGQNWITVNYGNTGQFINPTDYDDLDNKIYAGAENDQYLRWDNPQTGYTFTKVIVPDFGGRKISTLILSPFTRNRMFAALENGRVFRLDNVHTNSPAVTNITGQDMLQADWWYASCINTGTNDDNLILTYSSYGSQHVWTTANGGTTWTNVTGNLPDIAVRWGMFHPDDNGRAIIATDLGVWTTDNLKGAATIWEPETGLPPVRTDMLQYRPSDRTLAVATYGRGIWSTTLPALKPYIRFDSPTTSPLVISKAEQTVLLSANCRHYNDYTIKMNIDMAPFGDAAIKLSIADGATASQKTDFDFTTNGSFNTPSDTLFFPSGSALSKSFTLRLYDDAESEIPESLTFNFTVIGTTNASPAPTNQTYTFNILDNDQEPVAPIATKLFSNYYEQVNTGGTYYFYESLDIIGTKKGGIITKLSNASAGFGCLQVLISSAGNTWQPLGTGTRSQKAISIIPAKNPDATYTIGLYFTAEELAGRSPTALRIAKSNAAANGSTVSSPTSFVPYGRGYLFAASFSGLAGPNRPSNFFLVDNNAVPQVISLSFEGRKSGKDILLNWTTPPENNSDRFIIEKSLDGIVYNQIGIVKAAGNRILLEKYQFADNRIESFNYYRLKVFNKEGSYNLSPVVVIRNSDGKQQLQVANPFSDNIAIRFLQQPAGEIKAELVGGNGQVVYAKNYEPATDVEMNLSGLHLSQGIYFLRISADGTKFSRALIKK